MVAGGEWYSKAHFLVDRKQKDRKRKQLVPTVTQKHHWVCLIKKMLKGQVWWCTPLIPEPRRLKQEDCSMLEVYMVCSSSNRAT